MCWSCTERMSGSVPMPQVCWSISTQAEEGLAAHGPAKVVQMGGSTAMLFAARVGCIECAKALLAGGGNVNDIAPDGNSALVLAAHSGQGAFAAFLLDKDAQPNTHGAGYTALHAAVLRGDLDLVKALLAHGANPNARLENGTPLRRDGPDFALPESLVGATAFLLAAKYADVDMMRVLAAGGADVKVAAKDGSTPLLAAGAELRPGSNSGGVMEEESHAREAVKLVLDLGCRCQCGESGGQHRTLPCRLQRLQHSRSVARGQWRQAGRQEQTRSDAVGDHAGHSQR